MFPSNATAHPARQAPDMIRRINPPITLDGDCHQVSCHFEQTLFNAQTAAMLGVTLPATLDKAVQKRKAEFIAGRYCAQTALAELYLDAGNLFSARETEIAIGAGAHRAPVWPPGIVGSITHTQGYAAAMVACSHLVRAIGIDSECWIDAATTENIQHQILTPADHCPIEPFPALAQRLTLIFSAKESVFKCLYPLVNRFFDFHAAAVTLLPAAEATQGRFRFELLQDLNAEFRAGFTGEGCYCISSDYAHTAVILKTPTGNSITR